MAVGGIGGAAVRRARVENWLANLAIAPPPIQRHRHETVASQSSGCPELDCIRHLLPHRILAAAERRARSIGVGAERVLICADAMTEEAYLTALANSLDTSYERFEAISRSACPLDDDQLVQAAAAGLLPLREGRRLVWIIAPCGFTARRLADARQPRPAWLQSFRLTSADRLRDFVLRHGQRALGRRAADSLRLHRPLFSNAPPKGGWRALRTSAIVTTAFIFFSFAPLPVIEVVSGLCCALFLAAAILRLLSACFIETEGDSPAYRDDRELPVYTVICALYRETAVVEQLVGAIRALDYPPEKLDVKFVLEAEDHETRRTLLDLNLGPPFETIVAPPIGPRTKPKALNVALPLARGTFTVVYDAEDRPEPDQLRVRSHAFRARRQTARLRAGKSDHRQHRRQLARRHVHRRIMRASSTSFFVASRRSACRFRWAAHRIISAPARCVRPAAGTPTTSPKMPTSASASIALAIARGRGLDNL